MRRRMEQAQARIEEARRRMEDNLQRAKERVDAAMDRAHRDIEAAHRRHVQMMERAERSTGKSKRWSWRRRRPPEGGEPVPAVPSPKPVPLSGGAEAPLD